MIELLFLFGLGMMILAAAGAVIVGLFHVVAWLLWLPFKVLGWVAAAVATAFGALFCLLLLPFTIIGGLVGGILSLLANPAILLLIVGMVAFAIYQNHHHGPRGRTPVYMRRT